MQCSQKRKAQTATPSTSPYSRSIERDCLQETGTVGCGRTQGEGDARAVLVW
jgi:hypothetical protein